MLNRDRLLFLCGLVINNSGSGLHHRYGLLGAPDLAHPATDALLLIDDMHRSDLSGDGADRAHLLAHIKTVAFCGIDEGLGPYRDVVMDRACRTFLDAETCLLYTSPSPRD